MSILLTPCVFLTDSLGTSLPLPATIIILRILIHLNVKVALHFTTNMYYYYCLYCLCRPFFACCAGLYPNDFSFFSFLFFLLYRILMFFFCFSLFAFLSRVYNNNTAAGSGRIARCAWHEQQQRGRRTSIAFFFKQRSFRSVERNGRTTARRRARDGGRGARC